MRTQQSQSSLASTILQRCQTPLFHKKSERAFHLEPNSSMSALTEVALSWLVGGRQVLGESWPEPHDKRCLLVLMLLQSLYSLSPCVH